MLQYVVLDSRHEFRSLSTATCNVIRKCLPHLPLPISSLENPLHFSLDPDHTIVESISSVTVDLESPEDIGPTEPPNTNVRQTDSTVTSLQTFVSSPTILSSENHLNCSKEHKSLSLVHRSQSEPGLSGKFNQLTGQDMTQNKDKVSTNNTQATSLSWFINLEDLTNEAQDKKQVKPQFLDLSNFDKFFPELSLPLRQSRLSHSRSMPIISPPKEDLGMRSSASTSAIESSNVFGCYCLANPVSPKLVLDDFIHQDRNCMLFPDTSSDMAEMQYKKSPLVDR